MSVFSLVRPWEIPSLGVATPLQSTGTLPLFFFFFYRGPSPQTWRCWFSFELLPAGLLTTLAECYHLIKPKETNHLQKAEATLRPSNQRFSIGAVTDTVEHFFHLFSCRTVSQDWNRFQPHSRVWFQNPQAVTRWSQLFPAGISQPHTLIHAPSKLEAMTCHVPIKSHSTLQCSLSRPTPWIQVCKVKHPRLQTVFTNSL